MTIRKVTIALVFLLMILTATSGCTNYSFGDIKYNDSVLNFQVYNNGEEKYSTVQITIFSLTDFRQKEYTKCLDTFSLKPGLNEYSFNVKLEKGSYKMYLYILEDKKRASAEIRDITVR